MADGGATRDDAAFALDQLDMARRRFINVAGHELRTPITTIRGLADELLHADDQQIKDEIVPALVRNSQRLERLLDDLLIAADITTALPVGDPEPEPVVATAVAIWDALSDHAIEVTGDPDIVASLRPGTADRLLDHVLENALRYGAPPFTLDASVDGDQVRLQISSSGAELSADDLALAFELFYRGEGAVTSAPGFGLGLPVARALARQHGGDVSIAATPGGGVVVTVDLPAAEPRPMDRFGVQPRVIVADDEPDVRLLLRLQLRHHDIDVVGEAADGQSLLEMCARMAPDAIVLDLLMPRMNGFEVIPVLQREHPTIGIVAYTAVAGDFVRREMSRLQIPLLLKSGDAAPLADALRRSATTRS